MRKPNKPEMITCSSNTTHLYESHLAICPFCAAEPLIQKPLPPAPRNEPKTSPTSIGEQSSSTKKAQTKRALPSWYSLLAILLLIAFVSLVVKLSIFPNSSGISSDTSGISSDTSGIDAQPDSLATYTINAGQPQQAVPLAQAGIKQVVYSPNGEWLGVASKVGIYLYDAQTLEKIRFIDSQGEIDQLAFSPDGNMLLSVSWHNGVHLWDISGTHLRTFKHGISYTSAAFSPNGKVLAFASWDDTIELWDVSGRHMMTFDKSSTAFSLAFDPDGKRLASGHVHGIVRIWSLNGSVEAMFEGHTEDVESVVFSPDGTMLASASQDGTIHLRSEISNETLEGHTSWVTGIAFSPDGQTLASSSWDKTVRLWPRDRISRKILASHTSFALSVAFSPDGQTLVSASEDTVYLHSMDGTSQRTLSGHTNPISLR